MSCTYIILLLLCLSRVLLCRFSWAQVDKHIGINFFHPSFSATICRCEALTAVAVVMLAEERPLTALTSKAKSNFYFRNPSANHRLNIVILHLFICALVLTLDGNRYNFVSPLTTQMLCCSVNILQTLLDSWTGGGVYIATEMRTKCKIFNQADINMKKEPQKYAAEKIIES